MSTRALLIAMNISDAGEEECVDCLDEERLSCVDWGSFGMSGREDELLPDAMLCADAPIDKSGQDNDGFDDIGCLF